MQDFTRLSAKRIGQAIRRARHDLELSQEELAEVCGLDRSYVGQIERGETNVSLESMLMLCRGLRVRLSDLLLDAGL